MATNSGWSKSVPSGTSRVADGDDEIRSFKSYMQAWLEDEHYATDGSTTSAGVHKTGSGRIFSQAAQPTAVAPKGQMWHDSDDDNLYVYNGSAWTYIASGSLRTTLANTWSGQQTITGLVASVATITTLIADTISPSGVSSSVVTAGRLSRNGAFGDILSFTSANAAVRGLGAGDILTLTFQHTSGLSLADVVASSFTYDNAGGTRRLVWSSSVQQSDGSVILTIHAPAGGSNSTASIHVGNTFRFVGFKT